MQKTGTTYSCVFPLSGERIDVEVDSTAETVNVTGTKIITQVGSQQQTAQSTTLTIPDSQVKDLTSNQVFSNMTFSQKINVLERARLTNTPIPIFDSSKLELTFN